MELERDVLVSPAQEVPMVEGEIVLAIRALADCGVGSKAIARIVGVARNTVRRYLRQSTETDGRIRAAARRLTEERRVEARTSYAGPADGNAVVVQRLLAERGLTVSVRTIERAVADLRVRGGSRRWRPCAWKRRLVTRCRSILVSNACRSPARALGTGPGLTEEERRAVRVILKLHEK
jgi:hypothetical protein